jgi:hypothetical protein
MQVNKGFTSRQGYHDKQIERSIQKFEFCKVSVADTIRYKNLIKKYKDKDHLKLVCMGTRNGREVDLFRIAFNHPFLALAVRFTEFKVKGFHSILDKFVLRFGRSCLQKLKKKNFYGVEINPLAKRKDIYIGSFDDLPKDWSDTVDVIYSNSFDHSQCPYQTAKEWMRIAKEEALLVIAVNHEQEISDTDPTGNISLEDIRSLFPGRLLYYGYTSSKVGYSEICIEIKKNRNETRS